ncbi:MAG: gamma-glutamylcyclotransferase family protein [Rhodoferax sp.]
MLHRLFVYGTLAPGRSNAHVLAEVPGTWQPAQVRGTVHHVTWGPAAGYPGLVLDAKGGVVPGLVFTSDELPAHWKRLDAFEGEGYARVPVQATLEDGTVVQAFVYVLSGYQVCHN